MNPECKLLSLRLATLPCKGMCSRARLPSFYREGVGGGCWAAHTALTLLEALDVLDQVKGVLRGKGLSLEDLLAALLLHDTGKLTIDYVKYGFSQHNVLSAIISLDVLRRSSFAGERFVISRAILLHHEYRMWREVFSNSILLSHFFQAIKAKRRVRLVDRSRAALSSLEALVELILGKAPLIELVTALSRRPEYHARYGEILRISTVAADYREVSKALTLYWFVQLFDNRAASVRESLRDYWRYSLMGLEGYASDPQMLANKILNKPNAKLNVLLTLLPRPAPPNFLPSPSERLAPRR